MGWGCGGVGGGGGGGCDSRECACARVGLPIQYATRRRHCLRPVWLHRIFSTLSHKRDDFRKKVTEHIICFFTANFIRNISRSKKNSAIYNITINVKTSF